MKFLATAALVGSLISSVVAAPTELSSRTDSYNVCKKSDGWHKGSDCPPENQYRCTTIGLLNILNCVNILNGNTVQIPINVILGLKARNGGDEYCHEGGHWHKGNDCAPENQYQCTTIGLLNLLNCVNVLNGNVVQVPINIIVGLKARNSGGEYCHEGGSWHKGNDCAPENQYQCTTIGLLNLLNCVNLLNGNVVQVPINVILGLKARSAELEARTDYNVCKNGDSWSRGGNCDDENKYTCTTVGLLNVLNCVNALNGNVVQVPINVILGLKTRNAELKARTSEYHVCQSGSHYTWGSDCEKKNQYTCTTVGLLNLLNCVNALNGNTVQIPITAIIGL